MTPDPRVLTSLILVFFSMGADAAWLFVGPGGSDANSGTHPGAALASVQQALEFAVPGDTVALLPGVYRQDVVSVRAGEPAAPIRVLGPREAVFSGAGSGRIFDLRHGHIELLGFSIDGRFGDGRGDYREKLIYAHGGEDGISGLRLISLSLRNALGECVRLKGNARGNEIAHSRIERCGIDDFENGGPGKNGEAIYIGTAPEQLADPVGPLDASNENVVHYNIIRSLGSECVDIKEGSSRNRVESNLCLDQRDPDSGGISVRGNGNVIRGNAIGPTRGAGIRLGGDTGDFGIDNQIIGNQLHDNGAGSLKLMALPQARVCANSIRQPPGLPVVRMVAGHFLDVDKPCPPGD